MRLRVGVVYWDVHDGLGSETCELLTNLNQEAVHFMFNERLPLDLDIVFTYGPFGSLVPLANQLLDQPEGKRPLFIWWLTEQLPNPDLPEWFLHRAGQLRSSAERLAFSRQNNGEWRLVPQLRWLTKKGHRFRYYGDMCWLREEGLLSLLVTGSPWRAEYLRAKGFNPYTPPSPSYRPGWGEDLKLERDIPVLWLGKMGSRRRKGLLQREHRHHEIRHQHGRGCHDGGHHSGRRAQNRGSQLHRRGEARGVLQRAGG